jgi:cytochrome c oxidase subunit 2
MVGVKANEGRAVQGVIVTTSRSIHMIIILILCFTSALLLNSCTQKLPHSMLHPAGPKAAQIAWLWWVMFNVYGVVFIVTITLLVWALAVQKKGKMVPGSRFVVIAGIAFPTLILVIMLLFELRVGMEVSADKSDYNVKVIGRGWWFEVIYPKYGIIDANEIHIPVNTMVGFELLSKGMIHSFWVPRLGGKRDQLPDHPNHLSLQADTPGVYHGTCTEYCAGQHAHMAFRVIAHTPELFHQWLEKYQYVQTIPLKLSLVQGMNVYLQDGCAACHSINGISQADIGPDLTHVGSRLTLGAGQFENTWGSMSGWVANSQALKPGNKMPRTYLPPHELHTLIDYLRSLK